MWVSSVFISEVVRAFRIVKETLAGMSRRPEEARGSKAQCYLPHPNGGLLFLQLSCLGVYILPREWELPLKQH